MKRRIEKKYTDYGFGFPVVLHNVPMVQVFGTWTPEINYQQLRHNVLLFLIRKPARLTGTEVRFIRHSFDLTLQEFGERFDVRHSTVLKWEKAKEEPTRMNWSTEKDIRLFVADRILSADKSAEEFFSLYRDLCHKKEDRPVPIEPDYHSQLAPCGS